MTGWNLLEVVGTRCALCKKSFEGDEGVGVSRKGKLLWLHSECSRRLKSRDKRRRRRKKSLAAARRPRRMGAVR